MNLEDIKQSMIDYFKAFDNGDEDFYNRFDNNVTLQSANDTPIKGLNKLKEAFDDLRFSEAFKIVHHPIAFIVSQENNEDYTVATDIVIDYNLHNGEKISLPCASITKVENSKITGIKIFIDATPVYTALSA